MSAKHTPGPWEWDGKVWCYDGSEEAPWLVQAPWTKTSSKTVLSGEIRCMSEADARLIAAAPELLAFAQEFLSDYQSEDGMASMKHYARKAHEAIAKATGEQA